MAIKRVAIVYHSGHGHTQHQAEAVAKGARSIQNTEVTLITSEQAISDTTILDQADAIIFGCPTYMGGPSAQFKTFIDAASKIWFKQSWKNKLAAAFTNSGSPSGDKLNTLQSLFINAMQHSMIWIGLGAMNEAKGPEDISSINRLGSYAGAMSQSPFGQDAPVEGDLKTAEVLGKRVAEIAQRWSKD